MRHRKAAPPLEMEKAREHGANIARARSSLKHFDYIEEKTQNGLSFRTGVVCKCCGVPLITTVEVDDLQQVQRQGSHTNITRYMTQAATSAYSVATVELTKAGRFSKHQTPICNLCAQHQDTDWQAIYEADIERLRVMGMDISSLIGWQFVRVLEVEAS